MANFVEKVRVAKKDDLFVGIGLGDFFDAGFDEFMIVHKFESVFGHVFHERNVRDAIVGISGIGYSFYQEFGSRAKEHFFSVFFILLIFSVGFSGLFMREVLFFFGVFFFEINKLGKTNVGTPWKVEDFFLFMGDDWSMGSMHENGILQMSMFGVNRSVFVPIIESDAVLIAQLLFNPFLKGWPGDV